MSNYTNLLKTAREQAEERLAKKGLTGSSFQSVEDDPMDAQLLSPSSAPLVSKRPKAQPEVEDEEDFMTKYYNKLYAQNKELKQKVSEFEPSEVALDTTGGESTEDDGVIEKTDSDFVPMFDTNSSGYKSLLDDKEFMRELKELKREFPALQEVELFNTIYRESSFNPSAKSSANAVGLLQMMPEVLGEMGLTTQEVLSMEPADQLIAYKGYLKRWGYDGSSSLGILQAAPAYRNSAPSTVIYRKGSKQARMNPGWQNANGDVTKESIENYYRGSK